MISITWTAQETRTNPEGGDELYTEFGALDLDICTTDSYDVSSLLTTQVVEEGTPTTDNQRPNLDRVMFTAQLSDIITAENQADGALASTIELSSGARVAIITQRPGSDRRQDAFETLRDLCRNGTPVSLRGLRREIEGWQIEAVSSPRSVEDAGSLVCEITLQERRTAVLEEVDAPAPRVERGRRPANAGRSETEDGAEGAATGDAADRDQDNTSLYRAYLDRVLG